MGEPRCPRGHEEPWRVMAWAASPVRLLRSGGRSLLLLSLSLAKGVNSIRKHPKHSKVPHAENAVKRCGPKRPFLYYYYCYYHYSPGEVAEGPAGGRKRYEAWYEMMTYEI